MTLKDKENKVYYIGIQHLKKSIRAAIQEGLKSIYEVRFRDLIWHIRYHYTKTYQDWSLVLVRKRNYKIIIYNAR